MCEPLQVRGRTKDKSIERGDEKLDNGMDWPAFDYGPSAIGVGNPVPGLALAAADLPD